MPVLHANAHIGEDAFQRADDFRSLCRIVHAFDMKVDKTFALAADGARTLEIDKPAGQIALDDEYRMDKQADVETARIELADDGVDQKRHIVVDDFEDRYGARRGRRLEAYFWQTGFALGEKRPRFFRDAGKLVGAIALDILGHREPEQLGKEILGDVALALCQQGSGGVDQRHAGVVIAPAGNILDVHVCPVSLDSSRYYSLPPRSAAAKSST